MFAFSVHFTNCLTMCSILLVIPDMMEESFQFFDISETEAIISYTQADMNGTMQFIHWCDEEWLIPYWIWSRDYWMWVCIRFQYLGVWHVLRCYWSVFSCSPVGSCQTTHQHKIQKTSQWTQVSYSVKSWLSKIETWNLSVCQLKFDVVHSQHVTSYFQPTMLQQVFPKPLPLKSLMNLMHSPETQCYSCD